MRMYSRKLGTKNYIAKVVGANLRMSGDTHAEAIAGLKSYAREVRDDMLRRPDATLGKSMLELKRFFEANKT